MTPQAPWMTEPRKLDERTLTSPPETAASPPPEPFMHRGGSLDDRHEVMGAGIPPHHPSKVLHAQPKALISDIPPVHVRSQNVELEGEQRLREARDGKRLLRADPTKDVILPRVSKVSPPIAEGAQP